MGAVDKNQIISVIGMIIKAYTIAVSGILLYIWLWEEKVSITLTVMGQGESSLFTGMLLLIMSLGGIVIMFIMGKGIVSIIWGMIQSMSVSFLIMWVMGVVNRGGNRLIETGIIVKNKVIIVSWILSLEEKKLYFEEIFKEKWLEMGIGKIAKYKNKIDDILNLRLNEVDIDTYKNIGEIKRAIINYLSKIKSVALTEEEIRNREAIGVFGWMWQHPIITVVTLTILAGVLIYIFGDIRMLVEKVKMWGVTKENSEQIVNILREIEELKKKVAFIGDKGDQIMKSMGELGRLVDEISVVPDVGQINEKFARINEDITRISAVIRKLMENKK